MEIESCFYWKSGRCELTKLRCIKKRLRDCGLAEWYE